MSELLGRTETVRDRALQLFARCFESVAEIDYLTIFTATEEERGNLDGEATSMGALVGNKNGNVYRLDRQSADGLPTEAIRICNPRETDLIGCADFVVTNYPDVRRRASGLQGFREMHKTNHGVSYDIIELSDSDLQVAIYMPSIRMLGSVIATSTP